MQPLQSELLNSIPSIKHGFGTREHQTADLSTPLDAGQWQEIWESRPIWKQVHETTHAQATRLRQELGGVDAISTQLVGMPIAVVSADCVPILLARRDGSWVAAVHSGWRGTRARILHALWRELWDQGQRPRDWVAAVGPAIGPCCYEVSEEIADAFRIDHGGTIAVPRFRHLDLASVIRDQLHSLGVSEIDKVSPCTRCTLDPASGEPAFHSYRREGKGTWQRSSVRILGDSGW